MVVHQDEASVALDHRALGGEIERHDRDALEVDVLPDVELGPVRQGKHADGLPRVLPRVVEAPELGPLVAGVPAMVRRAEGEDPLLGPALFLVAPRAADRGVEAVGVERQLQRLRLHHVSVDLRSVRDGTDPLTETVFVHEHDELHAQRLHRGIAKLVHRPELPRRVDVEQREGRRRGEERLPRHVQRHRAVLADRVQQHGAFAFGRDLAKDANALALEPPEVGERGRCDRGGIAGGCRKSGHRSPLAVHRSIRAIPCRLRCTMVRCCSPCTIS
jgi:hypothetical protein